VDWAVICDALFPRSALQAVTANRRNNHASMGMSNIPANIVRISLGVLSLFVAWAIGGYLGSVISPNSVLVGGRETLAAKVGCSVAILIASIIIRRYLLRSFGPALLCLATTEVIVFVIIICFTGLTRLTLADVYFNVWWLFALTWNFVLAFLVGAVVGWFWDDWARKRTNSGVTSRR
jgi:hypothetical protein